MVVGLGRQVGPAPVDGRQVAALKHLLHHRHRFLVGARLHVGDEVVDALPVVGQDLHALYVDEGRVAHEGDLAREHLLDVRGQGGLGLGQAHGVVVAGGQYDLDVVGHVLEQLRQCLVLPVDVVDEQLVPLAGEDADAVDHVPGYYQGLQGL